MKRKEEGLLEVDDYGLLESRHSLYVLYICTIPLCTLALSITLFFVKYFKFYIQTLKSPFKTQPLQEQARQGLVRALHLIKRHSVGDGGDNGSSSQIERRRDPDP